MKILEKSALIFTIIAGVLSILEYFGIRFSKESFTWIPDVINLIIVWIYDNIILFEVNIWILLLVIFVAYKLKMFIKNKNATNILRDKEEPKSLLEIFNEFDEDTKKVFGYVMYCQEKNIGCTKQSINRELRDTEISNLEQDKIIENFIEEDIVESHYNIMDPTRYTLTKYGSDIAVALVKDSKRNTKASNE